MTLGNTRWLWYVHLQFRELYMNSVLRCRTLETPSPAWRFIAMLELFLIKTPSTTPSQRRYILAFELDSQ